MKIEAHISSDSTRGTIWIDGGGDMQIRIQLHGNLERLDTVDALLGAAFDLCRLDCRRQEFFDRLEGLGFNNHTEDAGRGEG